MIEYLHANYVLGVDFKPKGNCKTCFSILNNDILKDEVLIKYMEEKNKLNK